MHPLEVAVEKTVKSYIETNLGNTLRRSEKSLNDYFDKPHIIEMGDEIWATISKTKLSKYFKILNAKDMEDFNNIGLDFWLHFRKTSYFKEIYTDLVHFFFKKYGDKELDQIADEMGVTEKMVVNELEQTLSHGIEKSLAIGFLEERIRARLENFYLSPQTSSLIASVMVATANLARRTKISDTGGTQKEGASNKAGSKKENINY